MTGRQWDAMVNRVRGLRADGMVLDDAIAMVICEASTRGTNMGQQVRLSRMLWVAVDAVAPIPDDVRVPDGVRERVNALMGKMKRLRSKLRGPLADVATARVFPPDPLPVPVRLDYTDEWSELNTFGAPGQRRVRPADCVGEALAVGSGIQNAPLSVRLVKGARRAATPTPVETKAIRKGWQPLDNPSIVAQFERKGWRVS